MLSRNRKKCGKNVLCYVVYVVICGKICGLLAIRFFSKHMALDGQFYFLVLFGWMPIIPEGFHACMLWRSMDTSKPQHFQSM